MKTSAPTTTPTHEESRLVELGATLAENLKLRRDKEHRDRWQTGWGTKTNLGLALTVRRMAFNENEILTQEEIHTEKDMKQAERIAKHLGYEQTAYTSTSALIGLFCLPENPARPENRGKPHQGGCVVKTKELGFLFIQTAEEIGL